MSWNEPGPRYYYNDPSGTPYHDPSWYKRPDDKDDDQKEEIPLELKKEQFLDLSNEEIFIIK